MKKPIFIALLFFSFLQIPSSLSQNQNWNIALNVRAAMEFMQQGDDAGINVKHRNKSQVGASSGFGLSVVRRIKGPWHIGVEIGRLKSTYQLNLDRDFGDLDNLIRFTEPTMDGDYQNIDKIEYDNAYIRWAVCPYYYFNQGSDQNVHIYMGIGFEQRQLRKSEDEATYRDLSNYFFFGGEEFNHVPTLSQKNEAIAYFEDAVADRASFLNINLGMKINTSEHFAFIFEPYFTTSFKNYHPKLLAYQSGLGINFMLNVKF